MKQHTAALLMFSTLIFLLLAHGTAEANKSSVALQEPVRYTPDGKALVTCTVSHKGNNFLHHTSWLKISANGKEVARWDFGWRSLPESEVFTREAAIDATGPVLIEAEASCNIHGSKGPASMTLVPKGKK